MIIFCRSEYLCNKKESNFGVARIETASVDGNERRAVHMEQSKLPMTIDNKVLGSKRLNCGRKFSVGVCKTLAAHFGVNKITSCFFSSGKLDFNTGLNRNLRRRVQLLENGERFTQRNPPVVHVQAACNDKTIHTGLE